MIPTIRFSHEEVRQGKMRPDTWLLGCQAFQTAGVLMLENAFRPAFIGELKQAFLTRYAAYLEDRDYPDATNVGDRRTMITIHLEGEFNTPYLYANPLITPFVERILGANAILGSFGAVASLPSADDQYIHRDYPCLFDDDRLDTTLPCYAINTIVPLIELNELHGTTRVWKGSHRVPLDEAYRMDSFDPLAPVGSCLLIDYRLLHGGTANRSARVRPILYTVYHRPWFRDPLSFRKQPPLVMQAADYELVPDDYRPWLSEATLLG